MIAPAMLLFGQFCSRSKNWFEHSVSNENGPPADGAEAAPSLKSTTSKAWRCFSWPSIYSQRQYQGCQANGPASQLPHRKTGHPFAQPGFSNIR